MVCKTVAGLLPGAGNAGSVELCRAWVRACSLEPSNWRNVPRMMLRLPETPQIHRHRQHKARVPQGKIQNNVGIIMTEPHLHKTKKSQELVSTFVNSFCDLNGKIHRNLPANWQRSIIASARPPSNPHQPHNASPRAGTGTPCEVTVGRTVAHE